MTITLKQETINRIIDIMELHQISINDIKPDEEKGE